MTKARKYGIPFPGKCGTHNSITDVIGVKVGHTTLIDGEGRLIVGTGPIRTGVTCILPRGDETMAIPVYGAYYSLNGNGEMTGCHWIKESGFVSGPIMITNTHSVGAVHEATIAYIVEKTGGELWSLPVVAETWDGFLNDINGFHVRREHVFSAIQSASDGDVVEGNVGGGTGMICHQFKGGIGTSSRIINIEQNEYTVGVLVQANYGYRESLTIAGIPIGEFITDRLPTKSSPDQGSIIVIVATDAPLLPHQLDRLVRRVPLGIAKVGGFGGNSSGDIFLAFSTANKQAISSLDGDTTGNQPFSLKNSLMDRLFEGVVHATEEAIVNCLFAAKTMIGIDGNCVMELPVDEVIQILHDHKRLKEQ